MPDKKRPFVTGFFLVIVLMVSLFVLTESSRPHTSEISFSTFIGMVDSGKLSDVSLIGNDVVGKGVGKDVTTSYHASANAPAVEILLHKLEDKKTPYRIETPSDNSWIMTLLMIGGGLFLFSLLMGGIARGQGKQISSFGQSRARLVTANTHTVKFADVAGIPEAVEDCRDLVEFLKDPMKFQKLGGKVPKGILLMGSSGTGKTLLARAIAGEANVPFFSISGSDFVEMFVGVGASRVRDLFEQGKKNAPCIIFIDEIDAVGAKRGQGVSGGGHDEREQTLNQMLVEMDGFEGNVGVMIVAATNRPEVLDPALLRPGRFDRKVIVPKPDLSGRVAILKVHSKKIPLAPEVDLSVTARGTPGFTGADLEHLLNEAALRAAKNGKTAVEVDDLESARNKIVMGGDERKGVIMSEKEKRSTAVHEMGHTLAGWFDPDAHPVHMVSIIPRGPALGVTMSLPEGDQYSLSKEQMVSQIRMMVAGRAAEDLVIGQITTGASNDFERATAYARAMVVDYGMTDVGMQTFGSKRSGFLGTEEGVRSYSQSTARRIDREIEKIIRGAYTHVTELLTRHRALLDAGTQALLENETLNSVQLTALLGPPARQIA
jgi:cell division protease FtsH